MGKIKINKIEKEELKEIRKQAWSVVVRKNMIPLAIGLIIGGAFSLVINSLANDVINQMLAKAFGYRSLSYLSYGTTRWERIWVYVEGAQKGIEMRGLPLNGIMYGRFFSTLISFSITSVFLFCVAFFSYFVMRRFVAKKAKKPPQKSTDILILEELKTIREKISALDKLKIK